MYDTIIIGAGVAGLTAALYGQRRAMNLLVLSKDIGGQVNLTTEIENYPGFESITASELIERMSNQVKKLEIDIQAVEVTTISKDGDHFVVKTTETEYQAKTLVIAMGLLPRRLEIPGEKELAGKGVTYCATCDGPFFKGKRVAVVGGGNAALDAAEYLSKICTEVHLINRTAKYRAFEAIVNEVKQTPNITMYDNSEIKSIHGQNKVESITVYNNQTKVEQTIELDGIFIEIGRVASTGLVANLVKLDDKGQIIIDDHCTTSQPGIFAAGDATNTPMKQITVACGLGTTAILAAYQYLHQGAPITTDYSKHK
ncbi:MAG: Pyridine nucleotide-disulfide oxidoreductase, FAD/NAD(P)-binding domain-containing protein [Candidatus Falkowbacteria bacterium GW2011_GWA2_39_24]|uniref:Pyridine nucleotide-disulfide oxidoreductase, FAD/NAD(P)-binding domain-containing protein n=1 Tax=Candidatus Falkowbacteria bacterium GW2011_GWA2_39_24 TaxID=1618634 RepID=A0A0G0NG79_9BACT|nr:MAG: Pyridine nucleotide-disulfide oxidoreductase, FAD/NAD(P)-binding domain-containing protein [Candidatus Falkowbacteria bacterium GW2011_GWA2_39_24]